MATHEGSYTIKEKLSEPSDLKICRTSAVIKRTVAYFIRRVVLFKDPLLFNRKKVMELVLLNRFANILVI